MPLADKEVLSHLKQLCPDWDVGDVEHIEYQSGGYSNQNFALTYRERRYVLRIPQFQQPYVSRRNEAAWLGRLPASIGPKPVALDATTGLSLTPWVDGVLLVEAFEEHSAEALGQYLASLHGALTESVAGNDLPQIPIYPVHELVEKTYPEQKLPALQPQTLCHNDLNPWNITLTKDGWQTLDWEFLGMNDPLFDVIALWAGLECTVDLSQLLVKAGHPNVASEHLHSVQLSFWWREFWWAETALTNGHNRPEIRDQSEVSRNHLLALGVLL